MDQPRSRNVVSDKQMSPTEAAYLAGFIDGEGTITLTRTKRHENRAGFRYQPALSIAQSRRSALRRIVRLCGNGRLIPHRTPDGPHQKQGYRVQFTPGQIRHVLPQVLPYLIVKRAQATLMLRVLPLMVPGTNYTQDRWDVIERFRNQFRFLNQRGQTKAIAKDRTELMPKRFMKPLGRKRLHSGCSVLGCERPHTSKGYCKQHYKKFVSRGGPTQHQKTCVQCGSAFVSKRSDATVCSKRCGYIVTYARRKSGPPS